MNIDSCYVTLLEACKELEYGELRPNTLLASGTKADVSLTNEQVRLVLACQQHGTPQSIKVVAKTPIIATFSVKTRAGPATKTEKFN
jgi:hypothetical protein